MALASDRPTLGKWKWKFPQLAEISDSGRTCATLLLEYFRYWFYNVNRRWLIGSSWGRWNFATIEVKCSLSHGNMFWKVMTRNSELSRQWGREKWLMSKKKWYFMFVMVFVEHILWGGNCIQRQKNTGMIGVSFSKSVSKVRINVWDGSCKTHHFLGVQKCVLQLPSHIWQKTRLWKWYTPLLSDLRTYGWHLWEEPATLMKLAFSF